MRVWVRTGAGIALAVMAIGACEPPTPEERSDGAPVRTDEAPAGPRVIEVTPRVRVALGFGLANAIWIDGEDCAVAVDVLGSLEAARAARAALAERSHLPLGAVVYTHNHADHVFGGPGFLDPATDRGSLEVFAHAQTERLVHRVVSVLQPILSVRSTRMFGTLLPPEERPPRDDAGIGPALELRPGRGTVGFLRPTRTFEDALDATPCGVRMRLEHAPGETPDQIFVWLPDERVLLPGDNVYRAFPNLYTIRGTMYRDVRAWVRSLDRLRSLEAQHLVPSHTEPVSGGERIADILLAYRDAIQYVHDQTIRGMNRGLTPDELVDAVRLPPSLRAHPYLQETYGTVAWAVRSIFAGTLGWFDGDAATLHPPSPRERAAGYAELAGGPDALLEAARAALAEGRPAWAAELAGHVRRLDPSRADARQVQARALRALARANANPNTRHYALTQALELEGKLRLDPGDRPDPGQARSLVETIPIRTFLEAMPVHLDGEASARADLRVVLEFPDVEGTYTLHVRRGIAELREGGDGSADVTVRTTTTVWREVLAGWRSPALALARGEIEIRGGALDLVRFVRWFR